MSDIKFEGEKVIVQGRFLDVNCWDIVLDSADRRSTGAGVRRALVHDFNDGLTINWASDYPGGVTVNGPVKVGNLVGSHLRLEHHDLHLNNPGRRSNGNSNRRALVHDFNDGLTLNWNRDYPGDVSIKGRALKVNCWDVELDSTDRRSTETGKRRALVHDFNDGLTINWASDYPGGVTIRGSVTIPQNLMVKNLDVYQELKQLKLKVTDLEQRLAALERG